MPPLAGEDCRTLDAPHVRAEDRRAGWRRRLHAAWATGLPRALLGLAITAGFGTLFILRTDLGELVDSLREVSLAFLIPAVALNLIDVWFQAVRLRALLRHLSPPSTGRLFAALLVGIMGNNVLPMRMGTVLRAEFLSSRYGLQMGSALSAIVVEGFMDGLVLAALFVPVLLIVGTDAGVFWAVLLSGGIALGGLIAIRLAYAPRAQPALERVLAPLRRLPVPERVSAKLGEWAGAFADGVAAVKSERALLVAALATAGAWLATAGVYYCVGLAFDLDVDWTAYLVLTAAINVSGLVQASGGNVGPYEFVAAEVMAGFGVPRGAAGAYAIVTHMVRLLPLTFIGLGIFAWHTMIAPPNRRAVQSKRA